MQKSYKDYLKELPSREGEVEIDVKGSVTGYLFKGTFTCSVPNMQDYILADRKRAALNGGVPDDELDETIARTTAILSYLSVVLKKWPSWWEDMKLGSECLDANLIIILHDQVKNFEKEWKNKVWGNAEQGE